ncbi:hypothetical protein PV08_02043 [Exophiala spinifera]|uniref:Uncharacterized protein n=1 Tax=Exophiala spinifera TaxID=91928 RepID=A0A0D2BR36_9EURO|nr:uncharacterized protein PV08_02043 [Exophiala spinifera]KIW21463.1 hypothetical protein PV08_02043 [Exophiala spinifera]
MPISTDNLRGGPTAVPDGRVSYTVSADELLAIELFANTLLARIHFIFFLAALPDTPHNKRNALLEEADAALHEAEELCMSGTYPIRYELKAKYWYVRGFGADTNRDRRNAVESYRKAIEMDSEYEAYEGVRRTLYAQEEDEEEDEDDEDEDDGTRPRSILFRSLLRSTREEVDDGDDEVSRTVKEVALRPSRKRSSFSSQPPPPVLVQTKPPHPSYGREHAQAQSVSKPKHEPPVDLQGPLQVVESQLTSFTEQEALLSDTPSISKSQVDEALISNATSQDHPSTSKPTLRIQSGRRLSLTGSDSMPSSPSIPSPLRTTSFPSDFVNDAD